MAANKFFKSLLFTFTIAISLFGFSVENSFAYPVFAQQGYSNPRAANGKLACANCHLNQKGIEIEAPQGVLPNSVFEVEIKVPYDVTRQQISADGKPADLNVGGILISTIIGAVLTPSTDPLTQLLLSFAILLLYFSGVGILFLIKN